jgi:hypothetical protein
MDHARPLGSLVGGFTFAGLALYMSYKPRPAPEAPPLAVRSQVPAE